MDATYAQRYQEWIRGAAPIEFGAFRCRSMMHFWTIVRLGDVPIVFLEFGVRYGKSFRWWVEGNTHPESVFIGFDSFEGLPEKWETAYKTYDKGDLSTHGELPIIGDARSKFITGWFADTLPPFQQPERPHTVIHIDCDLYSSARSVFQHIRIKKGDTLIMDDAGVGDEFRAFCESGFQAKPIGHAGAAVVAEVLA